MIDLDRLVLRSSIETSQDNRLLCDGLGIPLFTFLSHDAAIGKLC